MKSFFSNILKPKEKAPPAQPQPKSSLQNAPKPNPTTLAPTTGSSSPQGVQDVFDAKLRGSSSIPTAQVTTTAASYTTSSPAVQPSSITPSSSTPTTPLTTADSSATSSPFTPPPASAATRAASKKHARAMFDDYTALIQTLFDHSAPLKKETEYFLELMDEWTGRDPVVEGPKIQIAARTVNTELPLVREKGMVTFHELNAQLKEMSHIGDAFLSAGAAKDEARRTHAIASLSRLQAVRAQCEQELVEAKRTQHETYVAEYARMHEKYGRNLDGSFKMMTVLKTSTPPNVAAATTETPDASTNANESLP